MKMVGKWLFISVLGVVKVVFRAVAIGFCRVDWAGRGLGNPCTLTEWGF